MEESLPAPDDEVPSTSAAQSAETTPKKGILKRPSLKNESEKRDVLLPLSTFRPSPDRFPEKPGTRIPKLQVTWWEKNAVAFIGETSDENNTDSEQLMKDLGGGRSLGKRLEIRQTAILDSEDSVSEDFTDDREMVNSIEVATSSAKADMDDAMSVASSTGSASSAVVGRWWTGRDTRYIPHCEKKGCNHAHHETGEYVTPTQRRNKELSQLKKELRHAIAERDDKDKHLTDLRTKVKEIEILNEAQASLSEGQRMMRREQMAREALEREKKLMEKKHAVRVNQLVQETMSAREEVIRLTSRVNHLEELLNKPTLETSTQTDVFQSEPIITVLGPMSPPDPTDPNQASPYGQFRPLDSVSPRTSIANIQTSLPEQLNSIGTPPKLISPLSISIDHKGQQQVFCSQEALSHHIQACQNEAFIWRTKAAQLEIVAKDQLLKIASLEAQLALDPNRAPDSEHIGSTQQLRLLSPSASVRTSKSELREDGARASTDVLGELEPFGTRVEECCLPECIEHRKSLTQDNEEMKETIEEAKIRVRELEEDITALQNDLEKIEEEKKRMEMALQITNVDIDSRNAEIAASLTTSSRLQHERDTMQKAIDYMENRMQVYRNTLLDHDLVVGDEPTNEWRRTVVDPRYDVLVCKHVQTELTSQQMSEVESEFHTTQQKLQSLSKEFSAKNTNMADKFDEIEKILLAKSELVDALSKQLEETRRQQRNDIESHQLERERYKKILEENAAVTERVPILEMKISQLIKEKFEVDARFRQQQEDYEDGLAKALEESLAKYKEQSNYWKDKLSAFEAQIERLKRDNAGLLRELEDQKMQNHLQKAELQRKLVSSIEHVEHLQSKIHKSQRDVECQALPRMINKYVACRPNVKNRSTEIEKGQLFDETEERLRVCQTELSTTRRQVTILQQKLVSAMQQQTDQKVKKRIAVVEERPLSQEQEKSITEKLTALENKNKQLTTKLCAIEVEKTLLVTQERSRIQKLASEFDNVQQKLAEDMKIYGKEKQWLQWRISNLEKDNSELQQNLQQFQQRTDGQSPLSMGQISPAPMRRTISEPEIGREASASDEISIHALNFSETNSHPDKKMEIGSVDDQSVPALAPPCYVTPSVPFSNLADVLNLVRSDLEQVLTQIDEPESAQILIDHSTTAAASFQTNMLDDVMAEWADDERKSLERQLKRFREERSVLVKNNKRLSKDLQVATAELEVFKREKPEKRAKSLPRSASATELNLKIFDQDEIIKWKEQAGKMFRELNRIRNDLAKTLEQNRELRYQLVVLKGDIEMAQCSDWASSCPLSPSLSYHTVNEAPRINGSEKGDELVIHEDPQSPFERGSNRASLSCSIMIRSESAELGKSRSRERTRSRSTTRKNPVSKDELAKREHRRQLRLPKNDSISSSMTSLYVTPREHPAKLPPMMSQSWHEKVQEPLREQTNSSNRTSRVISLREKVGRLTRENRELSERVYYLQTAHGRGKNQRVLELEKETEELRETVEQLVSKFSSDAVLVPSQRQYQLLQDEVEIRRKESAMYEQKLAELEEERREMYVVMFKKGQQAASIEMEPSRSLDSMTQDRVTLKFLHDAFYYYLVNKGDSREHLAAMMTMLDFTVAQKEEVHKRRGRST